VKLKLHMENKMLLTNATNACWKQNDNLKNVQEI